jgi:hypothetical protein
MLSKTPLQAVVLAVSLLAPALALPTAAVAAAPAPAPASAPAERAERRQMLSISDAQVIEGNTGTQILTFRVNLTRPSGKRAKKAKKVTVKYATADGAAWAGGDYVATSGKLVFKRKQKRATIQVGVIGDLAPEPAEMMRVRLSKARGGARISDRLGFGTILDDDQGSAPVTRHWLSVEVSKDLVGSGSVTSNPVGINCGGDCVEEYVEGAVVTLTAAPALFSHFTGWSGGGCTGTALTCTVTMDQVREVAASFAFGAG